MIEIYCAAAVAVFLTFRFFMFDHISDVTFRRSMSEELGVPTWLASKSVASAFLAMVWPFILVMLFWGKFRQC